MGRLAIRFCRAMELDGVVSVLTGTLEPTEHDPHDGHMRNILLAKTSRAGLDVIGRKRFSSRLNTAIGLVEHNHRRTVTEAGFLA